MPLEEQRKKIIISNDCAINEKLTCTIVWRANDKLLLTKDRKNILLALRNVNTSIYANSSCIKFMVAIHFNGHLTETCWTQCKDKIIYFYNSQFVFVSKYEVKLVRLPLDAAVSNQFQLFNSFQCYWLVIQKSIWTNRFYYFYCFFCMFECSISNMHTSRPDI